MFLLMSCEVIVRARLVIKSSLSLAVLKQPLLLSGSDLSSLHHFHLHIGRELLKVESVVHVLKHGSAHSHKHLGV